MTSDKKISSVLCGIAGEYFVAAELSRRGYVASLTLRNTRGIDLLVSNTDATLSVGIQVKATQSGRRSWILNKKAERDEAENLFYVFVRLNGLGTPAFHIVPRKAVATYVRTNHQRWLKTPGRQGQPHTETPIRQFADLDDAYLDRWDLLGLD